MIYDLSSNISLERTPECYFRPTDVIESLRQTRKEKYKLKFYATETEGAQSIAQSIATLIREKD